MIQGDLLSAFPHRQFHTLPDLFRHLGCTAYPNALRAMQGGSLYHFYDGLWYDPAGRRTHDQPCERRTRYRLSQPDTVASYEHTIIIVHEPRAGIWLIGTTHGGKCYHTFSESLECQLSQ